MKILPPLLWTYCMSSVDMMIPKQRGEGYLKTPIGHHPNALSKFIEREVNFRGYGFATVIGLDGYVTLPFNYIDESFVSDIEQEIIKPIAEFIGCGYELITRDNLLSKLQL
jgi:hypothetical protein